MIDLLNDNSAIVDRIKKTNDFKKQVQLYNDNLRSLAVYHFNDEDRNYSTKRINLNNRYNFDFNFLMEYGLDRELLYLEDGNHDEKKRKVLIEVRQIELKRITEALQQIHPISDKIDWLFENVAGMTTAKVNELQYENEFSTNTKFFTIIGKLTGFEDDFLNCIKPRIRKELNETETFEGMAEKFETEINRLPNSKKQDKVFAAKRELRQHESESYYNDLLNGKIPSYARYDYEYYNLKKRVKLDEIFKYSCWLDTYKIQFTPAINKIEIKTNNSAALTTPKFNNNGILFACFYHEKYTSVSAFNRLPELAERFGKSKKSLTDKYNQMKEGNPERVYRFIITNAKTSIRPGIVSLKQALQLLEEWQSAKAIEEIKKDISSLEKKLTY